MGPPYRRAGAPAPREASLPWVVKAMMAVIVVAAFIALVVIWSQAGAPSQMSADAGRAAPRPQGGVTTLDE